MPRVHHITAAKDYPRFGIKKGDKHYKWKIKQTYGGIEYRSLTYPRRSQLTSSEYLSQQYDFEDAIQEASDPEEFRSIASDVENLGSEQEEKLNNMPEGLQQGHTGELLEERRQACEDWASAINDAADELETKLNELEEEEKEYGPAKAAWDEYYELHAEWENDEEGEEPEPTEPELEEPDEEKDFPQLREDVIQEARDACEYPG